MEGCLLMSSKERKRLLLCEDVKEGRKTLARAAQEAGVCYRQIRRVYKRFIDAGALGLVHRRRGQPSNRRKPETFRAKVVARYEERYGGFGPTLAAEELCKEGLVVDHETLRRWLLEAQKWTKSRRRAKHLTRRARRPQFGELVQVDGSHHHWFGPQHPRACLMNLVDDARGVTLSVMAREETTEVAMRALWAWVERYGIPRALYADKKNVYVTGREPTLEEQLAGQTPRTVFGESCAKLGVEIISAHSPQAKGRVERNHGVYQDRLVKLLKLHNITTIEEANAYLVGEYLDDINAKFARAAQDPQDAHRPVTRGLDLAHVFCLEEPRAVANDWTVRYNNEFLQILKQNSCLPKPKEKVLVRTLLDGTIHLIYRGKPLNFAAAPQEPPRAPTPMPQHKAKAKTSPKCTTKTKPERLRRWRSNSHLLATKLANTTDP